LFTPGPALRYLTWSAWMGASLLPVSGIIKVGTFVSDRIVTAATLGCCILVGWGYTNLILPNCSYSLSSASVVDVMVVSTKSVEQKMNPNPSSITSDDSSRPLMSSKSPQSPQKRINIYVIILFLIHISYLHVKISTRSLEWMHPRTLLQSSLRTCPNSAKSHLEMSKVKSGMYDEFYNLDEAMIHLNTAERIDSTYCDVHQQFAMLHVRRGNEWDQFEERIVQGVLCPFSMMGSVSMFQQYWQNKLMVDNQGVEERKEAVDERERAMQRYQKYQQIIQNAVEKEGLLAEKKKKKDMLLRRQKKNKIEKQIKRLSDTITNVMTWCSTWFSNHTTSSHNVTDEF